MSDSDFGGWLLWIALGIGGLIVLSTLWQRAQREVAGQAANKFVEIAQELEEMSAQAGEMAAAAQQAVEAEAYTGRLGDEYVGLLGSPDIVGLFGLPAADKEISRSPERGSATVRFVPAGSTFEVAGYKVQHVADVAADTEACRWKAGQEGHELTELPEFGAGAFLYWSDVSGRGESCVLFFWDEGAAVRINLWTVGAPLETTQELARRMAARLPARPTGAAR